MCDWRRGCCGNGLWSVNQLGYCWFALFIEHQFLGTSFELSISIQSILFHLISSPSTPFDFISPPSFSTPTSQSLIFPSPSLSTTVFSNKHSNPPYRNHPHSLSLKTSSQSKPIPFQSPLFALALIFDRFPSSSSSSSYPFPVIKSRLNPLECTAWFPLRCLRSFVDRCPSPRPRTPTAFAGAFIK